MDRTVKKTGAAIPTLFMDSTWAGSRLYTLQDRTATSQMPLINQTACQGWSYLPIWNGYQAPCGSNSVPISTILSTAAAQGDGNGQSAALQLTHIELSTKDDDFRNGERTGGVRNADELRQIIAKAAKTAKEATATTSATSSK